MENILRQVVSDLHLIKPLDDKPEDFILTFDEVNLVINHELLKVMQGHRWYMAQKIQFSEEQILRIVASTDYHGFLDKNAILLKANSSKHHQIWEKAQRVKEVEDKRVKQEALQKKYSAQYVFSLMQKNSRAIFGKELVVNHYTLPLIKFVCFFISNDPRFETELGYSFKKGLLIRGDQGLGKTHILRCVENNEFKPMFCVSMIDINRQIQDEGFYTMDVSMPVLSSSFRVSSQIASGKPGEIFSKSCGEINLLLKTSS
jgi:hypothetical protein